MESRMWESNIKQYFIVWVFLFAAEDLEGGNEGGWLQQGWKTDLPGVSRCSQDFTEENDGGRNDVNCDLLMLYE